MAPIAPTPKPQDAFRGESGGEPGAGSDSFHDPPPSYHSSVTATEDTPLLLDGASTPTLRNESLTAADRWVAADAKGAGRPVGVVRAACIVSSMWALLFLQACNLSGMTMAQSAIAQDLDAYEDAMWFTSSYMIATASVAPLAGRLATIFTPAAMVLCSSALFAVGALVTSQAHSLTVFILGRCLIGCGGGGIMTLSLILALQLTSKRRRGVFIGLVNAGFTVGVSTGAVVFGALLPVIGWRALFWAQAPAGAVAGLGVYLSMPDFAAENRSKDKTTWQKLLGIDYAGALALTATIVLFLYGLSGTIKVFPMAVSVLCLVAFILIEHRVASDPIIPVSILKSRGVLFSCLAQLGFMAARWSVLYYAPIFVLAVRGLSPTVAGSVLIPTNLGFGLGGLIVGWLHIRRAGSFWLSCVASLFLFGAALFGLSLTSTAAAPAWLYVLVIFANGLCTGAALNYTLAHLLHLSSPQVHYVTTGLLNTFRGFAGSFGTAIGGGVFMRQLRDSLLAGFTVLDGGSLRPGRHELVTRLVGSPALVFGGPLSDAERAVAVRGYEVALRVLYQSAVALTVLMLVVQAGTGWTGPADGEEQEEIRQEVMEHEGRMEA